MRVGCWSVHPGGKRHAHSRKHCIERDSGNADAGWGGSVSQVSSFGVPNLAGGGFIMLDSCLFLYNAHDDSRDSDTTMYTTACSKALTAPCPAWRFAIKPGQTAQKYAVWTWT
jgi:hypothetical protein